MPRAFPVENRRKKTWTAEWPRGRELVDGRVRYRYGRKRGFLTEKAAYAYAVLQEATEGPGVPERLTFAQFAARWERDFAASKSPVTALSYKGQIRRDLLPHLGAMQLADLTLYSAIALYGTLRAKGKGEASILKIHRLLRLMLRHAKQWGLLEANPLADFPREDAPAPTKVEPVYPAPDAIVPVLAAAKGTPAEALVTLAVYTGLSKSELRGLQWQDLRGDLLTLRRTRQYVNGTGDVVLPMKRKRRARVVALVPEALAALPARGKPEEWIIDLNEATLRYWVKTVRQRAGLTGSRLHEFRHAAATVAPYEGATTADVSEQLGHASPAVTLGIYTHVLPGRARETAQRIAAAYRSAGQQQEKPA